MLPQNDPIKAEDIQKSISVWTEIIVLKQQRQRSSSNDFDAKYTGSSL
jgi:hypothetical protein